MLRIVTGEGMISEGDLFATANDIRFEAIETKAVVANDTVAIRAVVAGAAGNVAANTITQMPVTITGIAEVTNDNPAVDGYDAEYDDELRDRYYEALQEPATSGNVYHYKRWAKEVSGVGDAKVFGLWAGDNTVQVVIIDSDKKAPSQETVDRCQEYIDPGIAGSGEGEAPVGAYCTVTAATALEVNIETTLDYEGAETVIRTEFEEKVTEYLASIAFQSNYVSIAKIGDILLDIDGVNDYLDLEINGSATRVQIPEKSVAILGTVTIHEAE